MLLDQDYNISAQRQAIVSQRFERIALILNREFWECESKTAHSLYVGSYGRGTAIKTSDIDMLFELPQAELQRFNTLKGNSQSRLLQTLKNTIKLTYPTSNIRGDGQVVEIDFSDGIKFDVLPAFPIVNGNGDLKNEYKYPDTNMGGRWLSTNPRAEQDAMKKRNIESNGLLFDTCKLMRSIRDKLFYKNQLPGIVIDSYMYYTISGWHYSIEKTDFSSYLMSTFTNHLYENSYKISQYLYAPGSCCPIKMDGCVKTLRNVLNYMLER